MTKAGDNTNKQIEAEKQALSSILGENTPLYLSNLKQWFSLKISKEEFDRRSKDLIPFEHFGIHNKLILSIISKCYDVCYSEPHQESFDWKKTSIKQDQDRNAISMHKEENRSMEDVSTKMKQKTARESRVFVQPYIAGKRQVTKIKPPATMSLNVDLIPRGQEKPKSLLCANEFRIPDLVLLQGRILVHSFDWDLNGTDEQAVHILHKAVHGFIKNILSVISKRRHGFQLGQSETVHSFGLDVPDPWLQNTWSIPLSNRSIVSIVESSSNESCLGPSIRMIEEAAEQTAAYKEACASNLDRRVLPRASLFDFLEALKVYKSVIPTNTLYILAMEKIMAKMHERN
ncbi:transcriptional adapter 1-like [Artemia franciscana]|uniref:Transcriptional adapter 1-like protein n=1 Tax=Artemia franciscana TaxID=6661 RepID=A0AA88L3B7_ARTSF|nr:hypothetical protein QYM36_009946 [Artemia franciscana]